MKKMQDEPPEVENAPPTASELQLQEVMDKVFENYLVKLHLRSEDYVYVNTLHVNDNSYVTCIFCSYWKRSWNTLSIHPTKKSTTQMWQMFALSKRVG